MDWEKAKKLTIFFLCLLNIALFGLIYNNNRAYRLSSSQEQLITSVLQRNNIICYVEVLKNFTPMRQIEMQKSEYDHDLVLDIFVQDKESLRQSMERNRVIYRNENETLTIDDAEISYRNRNDGGTSNITVEEAERIGREFLRSLSKLGGSFVADGNLPAETEEGYLFQFRESYRGYIINSNYAEITVNENGVARVEFMYYKPVFFVGVRREICSADEALLTVMHGIKDSEENGSEPRFITKMDIVYHDNLSFWATPYYRVFVSGFDKPFLINAYENSML